MFNIIHHHSRLVYDSLQPPVDVQVGEWVLERNARHFRVIQVPLGPHSCASQVYGDLTALRGMMAESQDVPSPPSRHGGYILKSYQIDREAGRWLMVETATSLKHSFHCAVRPGIEAGHWNTWNSAREQGLFFFAKQIALQIRCIFWKFLWRDQWHLTFDNFVVPKVVHFACLQYTVSSIFHIWPNRWRPLKRSAVKPAWTAPWWISSRLTVTWPHLHPSTRKVKSVLVRSWWRTSVHTFFRAWLTFLRTDFIIWIVLLICNAFYEIVRCMMMLRSFMALFLVTSGLQVSLFSIFTVSTELLSRGEGFGALQGEEKWSAVLFHCWIFTGFLEIIRE